MKLDYDYIIIGSGFGGSVSALRLAEKGYKVLVLEKGRWFTAKDFPKTNWNLKKWLWEPKLNFRGIFKMTFLNHVTVLSGVGVGGGSLTYANTLPVPKKEFYTTGSWASLNDWEKALAPFYDRAYQMLGANITPRLTEADLLAKDVASDIGKESHFEPTKVSVYFGEEGKTVKDPYFAGKGPDRTGCIFCGACMTGCRHNAKNTLDKNYLYLAMQLGVDIRAEQEVTDIAPLGAADGSDGYTVTCKQARWWGKKQTLTTRGVIFAGGVLGTVPLLLDMKEKSGSLLSDRVGDNIRTNNESIMLVTSTKKNAKDYSTGVAIGSIVHTDDNSHLEPVRYGKGSSFFRLFSMPAIHSKYFLGRMLGVLRLFATNPLRLLRTVFSTNYSTSTVILLFMQTLDSTLILKKGRITKMKTVRENGPKPTAFMPEAFDLAQRIGKKIKGIPYANVPDTVLGTPTTAHVLGGAVMGKNRAEGVIDQHNRVFGYKNMMVCDGSMISANPGVNPSLSITAITEYAMARVPKKNDLT